MRRTSGGWTIAITTPPKAMGHAGEGTHDGAGGSAPHTGDGVRDGSGGAGGREGGGD